MNSLLLTNHTIQNFFVNGHENRKPHPLMGGVKRRGVKMMALHAHPSPLPSRERGTGLRPVPILGSWRAY